MPPTAHADSFARDNLPPHSQWPELLFERPEFRYPALLNCATELLDKMVSKGHGHRPLIRSPAGGCTYTELYAQANRIANVLVREMGLKPGNRVLLRGPNNPMMAACWFAVMKAGGVCVATMPLLRAKSSRIVNKGKSHAPRRQAPRGRVDPRSRLCDAAHLSMARRAPDSIDACAAPAATPQRLHRRRTWR